jgi:hypothetical protein
MATDILELDSPILTLLVETSAISPVMALTSLLDDTFPIGEAIELDSFIHRQLALTSGSNELLECTALTWLEERLA